MKPTFTAEPRARATGSAQITGGLSLVTHASCDVFSGVQLAVSRAPPCGETLTRVSLILCAAILSRIRIIIII